VDIDLLLRHAGQPREKGIEGISAAKSVDWTDVSLERVDKRKIAVEPQLDRANLRDNRIWIMCRAPKSTLRTFKAEKFAVEYDRSPQRFLPFSNPDCCQLALLTITAS
jgi:hypothetical protein